MSRYRSKLVKAVAALILLAASVLLLWPSLGTSATNASATYALATAVCPTPGNNACITNHPTATAAVKLNGKNQSTSYRLAFTLNNSIAGNWHVTIISTQFTSGSHTLPTNASSVTDTTTVPACSGNTCPVNSISYTPPVGVPVPPATPATFYDNTGGGSHGVGTFNIQATIQVTVPANTYAGIYSCTITITFVSGSP